MAEEFDYVVVGAGSAGACWRRGCRRTRTSGCCCSSPVRRTPCPKSPCRRPGRRCGAPRSTTPTTPSRSPHAGGVAHNWPRGHVLGGSSSINAMVYLRGHRADFDDWAKAGCAGGTTTRVLPYFRRMETVAGGDPAVPRRRRARCVRRRAAERRTRCRRSSSTPRPRPGYPADRRLQRRPRRRAPGGTTCRSPAAPAEHGGRVPAPGPRQPAEPDRLHRLAGAPAAVRRHALHRASSTSAHGEVLTAHADRRGRASARAPSTRPGCCCCPASAPPTSSHGSVSTCVHDLPGVGRQPARPPAVRRGLRGEPADPAGPDEPRRDVDALAQRLHSLRRPGHAAHVHPRAVPPARRCRRRRTASPSASRPCRTPRARSGSRAPIRPPPPLIDPNYLGAESRRAPDAATASRSPREIAAAAPFDAVAGARGAARRRTSPTRPGCGRSSRAAPAPTTTRSGSCAMGTGPDAVVAPGPARARPGGAARRRRVGDAAAGLRQHQRRHDHDRREGRGPRSAAPAPGPIDGKAAR